MMPATDEARAALARDVCEKVLDLTLLTLDPVEPAYLSTGVIALVTAAAALGMAGGLDKRAALALITITAETALKDMEADA